MIMMRQFQSDARSKAEKVSKEKEQEVEMVSYYFAE